MASDTTAIIKVGDTFSLTGEGVYKGVSKEKNFPYIMVIKKAERGFASVKMFVHNATDCLNAQSVTVKTIIDANCSPRKAPNGKIYTEFKITADCEPKDVFAEERKKTGDEFMDLVSSAADAKPEAGLFDTYMDGNDFPFA